MPDQRTRPLPPDLEFRAPLCPICDDDTATDGDSYWCESCGVSWGGDGLCPEWDDPDTEQCPSTTYNGWTGVTHRCILTAGHAFAHSDGRAAPWTDRNARPTPENTHA